jgi:type II secretory pathway component PulF
MMDGTRSSPRRDDKPMNADELVALNDQIAGMARAGLPLDAGLNSLATEMGHGRLRRVTEAIVDDLRAGATLPEAVARRQKELPPYYANLISAGVRTGRLPEVLATLTTYAKTVAVTRMIILDSMFYPVVVLTFAVVLLAALVFFVLPQFDAIFKDFNMRLPMLTEWVLTIGRYPIQVLTPLVLALLGLLIVWMVLRPTRKGQRLWAWVLYSIPLVGTLVRAARLSAFADLMAVLVEYELPLPEAFRLAGGATTDPLMARDADEIHGLLVEGATLSEALRGRGLLPEWVAWMAGAGAQRGALAPTLRQIAELYRRQVEARAALLRTVLPAFMIIATAGLLVGIFAITTMLPMIKLLEGLAK